MGDTRVLNYGIIGCGRVSPRHLDSLAREIPNARLAAVCDIQVDRARAAGEKYKVPFYDSMETMLDQHPEIDVVNILTPSGLHAEHAIYAISRKKHVVVEKPMALMLEDAEAVIRAAAAAGVRLFVVKQNRYNLPVQKLKESLDAGRFGKMVMGTVRVRWCRPQSYYDQDDWRGTWRMDGGVIANQASHHIDLLEWMLGDVESVFAYGTTRLANIECDDTAVAVLRFTNGALGVFEATTAARPSDLEGSLSVLGEGGSVEIGGFAVNKIRTWKFKNESPSDAEVIANFSENPPGVYGFGHTRLLAHITDSILNNTGGVVDGIEGIKSLLLINAMYESMETGKEVRLKFRTEHSRLGRETEIITTDTAHSVQRAGIPPQIAARLRPGAALK